MLPVELIDLAQKIGAAGAPIFALLWWLERGERKDAQAELKAIAKDSTTALIVVEKTIDKWAALFKPRDS